MRYARFISGTMCVCSCGVSLVGCGKSSDDDVQTAVRIVDDDPSVRVNMKKAIANMDFTFTFGDGSGQYGYNVLEVPPTGTAQYTFLTWKRNVDATGNEVQVQEWRQVTFAFTAHERQSLRSLLQRVQFFDLEREYHAAIMDGTQRWNIVEIAGKRKLVYANNYFPSQVMQITEHVHNAILRQHAERIANAEIIRPPAICTDPPLAEPKGPDNGSGRSGIVKP